MPKKTISVFALHSIMALGIYNFGWGFADPFFSQFLYTFTDHYVVVGLLTAMINAIVILVLIPVGAALEKVSHRFMMDIGRLGYVCVGVAYVCAGVLHSFPLLIVALVLNGLFLPFVWASILAILEKHSTRTNVSTVFGLYAAARQLMWAAGLIVALLLLSYLPLYAIFVPVIICPLISIWFSHRTADPQSHLHYAAAWTVVKHPRALLRRFVQDVHTFSRELLMAYVMYSAAHVVYVFAVFFLPLFVISLGYSITAAGVLVFILNLPFMLNIVLARKCAASRYWSRVVLGCGIAVVGALALYFWHDTVLLCGIGGFIMMCGYACVEPALSSIIATTTPRTALGTSSACVDIAQFFAVMCAAPLIGWSIDTWSWSTVFLAGAVYYGVLCIGTACIARYSRRAPRKRATYHRPHIRKHPSIV